MSVDRVIDPDVPGARCGAGIDRHHSVPHVHLDARTGDIGHQREGAGAAHRYGTRIASRSAQGHSPHSGIRGLHTQLEAGQVPVYVDVDGLVGTVGLVDERTGHLDGIARKTDGLHLRRGLGESGNDQRDVGTRSVLGGGYGRDENEKKSERAHDDNRLKFSGIGTGGPGSIDPWRGRLNGWLLLFLVLVVVEPARANDLSITNVRLAGQDASAHTVLVEFDVAWQNSWRLSGTEPNNWDAVWLFAKYRTAGGDWYHATLSTSGHAIPSGAVIGQGDGLGVFLHRSAPGTGAVSFTDVRLRWNYGADGVGDTADQVEVRVLGIEMVYIPQGAFAAGGIGTETNAYTLTTISTADATVTPSGAGSKGGQAGGFPTGQLAPSTPSWPNGFAAFYVQKYEITQGQYADFLSLLTASQAANRNPPTVNRLTITGSYPNFYATAPARACPNLNWADGTAYADWAGLRPMTELEFEKAQRGPALPVADEFAWGTNSIHTLAYTVSNDGASNASITNPGSGTGNANYASGAIGGPLRAGIFAVGNNREESGAGYYGVMDLSGNLAERPVGLESAASRAFDGSPGDGTLSQTGNSNAPTWFAGSGVHAGMRGGNWSQVSGVLRLAARPGAANLISGRQEHNGFRLARTAP